MHIHRHKHKQKEQDPDADADATYNLYFNPESRIQNRQYEQKQERDKEQRRSGKKN